MKTACIVKVAVSAAPYSIDKPYDYLVPEPMTGGAVPGVRVMVPFGRGNRESEGQYLDTAALRHHNIEHHGVEVFLLHRVQRLLSVVSALMLVTLRTQIQTQGLMHDRIVVRNQNERIHRHQKCRKQC